MARGGIYDQLAGGFARYSVDAHWTVPHFEKMLYDNALLLRVYTQLWRLTGDPLAAPDRRRDRRVPRSTTWPPPTAGSPRRWTPTPRASRAPPTPGRPPSSSRRSARTTARWAADLFGVTEAGTFEHGTSVLRLARDIDDADAGAASSAGSGCAGGCWRPATARPQPARDDKVVAAWNGLAITALAEYAAVADRRVAERRGGPAAVAARRGRCRRDLATDLVDGRLRRVSRDGVVGEPAGVLEDYGCVAEAFCARAPAHRRGALAGAGRAAAGHRAGPVRRPASGGFYDTADDAEQLVTRPADPTDNATPSGPVGDGRRRWSTYAALTGETALPGGRRGGAGHGRADRRPARPVHRVRRRGR